MVIFANLINADEDLEPCPIICPMSYDPYCATDLIDSKPRQFANMCTLKAANCRLKTERYSEPKHGECVGV